MTAHLVDGHLVDGIRCAQVEVDATAVTLSFLGDLTPVEAVAVFLRDVADLSGVEADLLLDLADQLDPVASDPVASDPVAGPAELGRRCGNEGRDDHCVGVDTDAAIRLGGLALAFGRVERITRHDDGLTPESDTDHTVMLGLLACAFAAEHLPQLDLGLVAQLALVHDVVEAYAGDTPTLRIDADQQAAKQAREAAALDRIHAEFATAYPWLVDSIACYEAREVPEARYVKALDKLVPKITHVINGGATMRQQGLALEEVAARYERQLHELRGYAADFPALFELRAELIGRLLEVLAGEQGSAATRHRPRSRVTCCTTDRGEPTAAETAAATETPHQAGLPDAVDVAGTACVLGRRREW